MLNIDHNQLFSTKEGILRLYWRVIVRPHIWQALIIALLLLAGAILEMVTVALAVPLLDVVTKPNLADAGKFVSFIREMLLIIRLPTGSNMVILALLVVASALYIVRSGFSLVQQCLTAVVAHKLRREMKFAMFERFLYARYENLTQKGRGAVLHDMNITADSVYSSILQLGILSTGIINSAALFGLMFYLSWWGTLAVGFLAIGGVQGMRRLLDRRAEECGRIIYELRRDQGKIEVDSIDGLKVVKAHGLEGTMVERQQSLLAAEERPTLRSVLFRNAPSFVNETVASLIVLGLAAITFLSPSMGMRFSTMVAFLLAIRRLSPAIASINSTFVELNKSRRGIEVIEEVLHLTPPEEHGQRPVLTVEEIKLADISFYYAARPEHWVLRDIHLIMKRGTVTAIVGPTGAGKSTIVNLIIGLYGPHSGTVLINGNRLNEMSLKAWRRKVGYVCQDTFLFNATLRENIALWDPNVPQEDVQWAARVAQLHDFVLSLPEGYETIVGDRGLRLSGGQCQRVAIARAILRRPEVLIFDEATSALDNLTERAVYEAISVLHADAIVLVIAHRLSTVRGADQIVVIQAGQVVEVGSHESLMQGGGIYSKLYDVDIVQSPDSTS